MDCLVLTPGNRWFRC